MDQVQPGRIADTLKYSLRQALAVSLYRPLNLLEPQP